MILLVPFIYIYNADQEVLPSFKRHELKKNLNYLSAPYLKKIPRNFSKMQTISSKTVLKYF